MEALLEDPRVGAVRVLDNLATGFRKNIEPFFTNPKFEFLEGDIRNFNTCFIATKDIDLISHQAALGSVPRSIRAVSYTHLRAHETVLDLVCRLLLEKKKQTVYKYLLQHHIRHQNINIVSIIINTNLYILSTTVRTQ